MSSIETDHDQDQDHDPRGISEQIRRTLFNSDSASHRTIPFSSGVRNEPFLPQTDSLLPCDSLKEFYIGLCSHSENIDMNLLQLPDIEETYTSSLFQTEPLYQFYDTELGHVSHLITCLDH